MNYSVDVFQNKAPDTRWTGIVRSHPAEGGYGQIVHQKNGYASENAAADGCDRFIEKQPAQQPAA